jgi:hypothetical protein
VVPARIVRHYPDTDAGEAKSNMVGLAKHQKDKKTSNMCELFDKLEGANTDVVTARHSQRNA